MAQTSSRQERADRPSDRRYQIFVSSTFIDLKPYRKEAIDVIWERGHIPIDMATFSAAHERDRVVIERAIKKSQIYLLILGHRYGSLVPDTKISYTELEYELAKKAGLYIIVLSLNDGEVNARRGGLDRNKSDDLVELQNEQRLWDFRNGVVRDHYDQPWSENGQFKFEVLKALDDNLPKCKKLGFVEEQRGSARLIQSASQNEFIVDTVSELTSFDKLAERCLIETQAKRELAAFFRETYMDRLIAHRVSLFFESGSTVAFVAKELSASLVGQVEIRPDGELSFDIKTNNVFAYLQLWLKARIPCTTFPWSPPTESTYGAFYGGLERIQAKVPHYDRRPLDQIAKREIARLVSMNYGLTKLPDRPALLIGAASGLQIGSEHKIREVTDLDQASKDSLQREIDQCYGPHVGSYHNAVFKRFMYETRVPLLICLTGDKIDCEIDPLKCHFVLDDEFTWERFCREHPVAFCIGCSQRNARNYEQLFRALGFEVIMGRNSAPITAFIARNEIFVRHFDEQMPLPKTGDLPVQSSR
jgi:uncharacterized protein DUF4062